MMSFMAWVVNEAQSVCRCFL